MFGISGITGHWQSTVLGVLGMGLAGALSGGLINPATVGIVSVALPQVIAGASAMAGVLGVLYKGK